MQTSVIKALLHPIKRLISPRQQRQSAATSELREESEMQSAELMQNEEAADLVSEATSEITDDEDVSEGADPTPSPALNTKAHLSSNVPRAARVPLGSLTKGEMAEIRSIFGNMDDAEIQRLYKRVTK